MLLESRLSDDTVLFIDCETVGGFDKSDAAGDFRPDDAISHVCKLAGDVAMELSRATAAAARGKPSPAGLELSFAIKVDSKATVAVARNPNEGQFKVRVRWGR